MKYTISKHIYLISLALLCCFIYKPISAHDYLLEFKGAYFLSTDPLFKQIFCNGSALCGPEFTFQVCRNWYGFVSADFFSKCGTSVGLNSTTKIQLVPLGLGAKYFVPYCYGDFYLGLGFQPTYLKTINNYPFVAQCTSQWGFGGIAKVGSYINLPCNFFLDLFVDYSFVWTNCNNQACNTGFVVPLKSNLSGAIFGAGLGYRF